LPAAVSAEPNHRISCGGSSITENGAHGTAKRDATERRRQHFRYRAVPGGLFMALWGHSATPLERIFPTVSALDLRLI
jgi:hypothetical protein